MFKDEILKRLENYKEDIERDLADLIAINSQRDLSTKKEGAPFGMGIRRCFDKMIHFAKREGLKVEDFDGYAIHIEYGEGREIFSMLGHIDIVEIYERENWKSNPFQLLERDGFWYGRGVNDNKGPIIGCFYLLKILKEIGYHPNKRIRLIIGGAEETTWECMEHYFKYNEMPIYGFSPDGNFPIVNCEKGIGYYQYHGRRKIKREGEFNIVSIKSKEDSTKVCSKVEVFIDTNHPDKIIEKISPKTNKDVNNKGIKLIYEGLSAMGRNPHRGENAIFKFVKDFKEIIGLDDRSQSLISFLDKYFLDSIYGEKLGLFYENQETGITTNNLSYLTLKDNDIKISFDYRYPKGVNYNSQLEKLKKIGRENILELEVLKELPLLYVSPDSKLILSLKEAYKSITGESPELFSKGAASYARVLQEAVAFGPTFPGEETNSHKPNECMKVDSFFKALLIYTEAIKRLT